jgi:hypothetical protein
LANARKSQEKKAKNKAGIKKRKECLTKTPFLSLTFTPPQQAIEAVLLAWAFWASCLSARAVKRARVLAQHDNSAVSMGTPVV